jgi:hypothetical protein
MLIISFSLYRTVRSGHIPWDCDFRKSVKGYNIKELISETFSVEAKNRDGSCKMSRYILSWQFTRFIYNLIL